MRAELLGLGVSCCACLAGVSQPAIAAPTATDDRAKCSIWWLPSNGTRQALAKTLLFVMGSGRSMSTRLEPRVPPMTRIKACDGVLSKEMRPPDKARALQMRGVAKAELRDFAGSIKDLTAALELMPKDAELLYTRANVFASAGDNDAAAADFSRVIAAQPTVHAYSARANHYLSVGNTDAALKDFAAGIKAEPANWWGWNARCRARATRLPDQLPAAELDCDQALEFSPDNGVILETRGLVRLKLKKYQEAWSDFDAAVAKRPREAGPLYGRGIASVRVGKVQQGRADIAHAKKLDPKIAETYVGYGVPMVQ